MPESNHPQNGLTIKNKMQAFLDKYNSSRDQNTALSKAWGAAVGRNLLYAKTIPYQYRERQEVKSAWAKKVTTLAAYPFTSAEYEAAFLALKNEMNAEFSQIFGARGGFRVSHAQKGLAVYMKHLWCMGKIEMPPECPIDKVVLSNLAQDAKYKKFGTLAWTKIDDIETHQQILSAIRDQAARAQKSVAEWELSIFN